RTPPAPAVPRPSQRSRDNQSRRTPDAAFSSGRDLWRADEGPAAWTVLAELVRCPHAALTAVICEVVTGDDPAQRLENHGLADDRVFRPEGIGLRHQLDLVVLRIARSELVAHEI